MNCLKGQNDKFKQKQNVTWLKMVESNSISEKDMPLELKSQENQYNNANLPLQTIHRCIVVQTRSMSTLAHLGKC